MTRRTTPPPTDDEQQDEVQTVVALRELVQRDLRRAIGEVLLAHTDALAAIGHGRFATDLPIEATAEGLGEAMRCAVENDPSRLSRYCDVLDHLRWYISPAGRPQ